MECETSFGKSIIKFAFVAATISLKTTGVAKLVIGIGTLCQTHGSNCNPTPKD